MIALDTLALPVLAALLFSVDAGSAGAPPAAPEPGAGGQAAPFAVVPTPSTPRPLAVPKSVTSGPPRLIWTGFQARDGGGRVFLQLTREAELDVRPSKTGLVATLKGCRIYMENNARTLDTRFFDTPVKSVAARQRRGNVEVEIVLGEPVTSTPHSEPGPDGTQFWVLDFPTSTAAKPSQAPTRP